MTIPGSADDLPPLSDEQVSSILALGTIRDPQPGGPSSPAKVRRARRRYLRAVRRSRRRRPFWRLRGRIFSARLRLAERAYRLISGTDHDW